MTRDDILRLADKHATLTAGWMFSVPDMEDFYRHAYEAGVAAEREACAKLCDDWLHADGNDCAEAIRARGQNDTP